MITKHISRNKQSLQMTPQNTSSAQKPQQNFTALLNSLRKTQLAESITANTTHISKPLQQNGIAGDYLSSFHIDNPNISDTHARPQGMAHNSLQNTQKIDKTDALYEQALALESYVVQIMINSMRATINKTGILTKNSFASKMYRDMMYEELSRTVTKHAGFGLADQIYLQLQA